MLKWALALAVALSSLALITTGNGDEVPPASNIMLTSYENNNIKVFSDISPSVVYVTNTQVVRRRFSFNAMEVPSGSKTMHT